MELLQLIDTGLHLGAIAYVLGLAFTFAAGLPRPRPVKTAIAIPTPHPQKNSCEDALEPPLNQIQVQTTPTAREAAFNATVGRIVLKTA